MVYTRTLCQVKDEEDKSKTIELWTRPDPNGVLSLGVDVVSKSRVEIQSMIFLYVCCVSIAT